MIGDASDFLTRYPEFQSLEINQINRALQDARSYVNKKWGKDYYQGLFSAAAHILALRWLQTGAIASTAVAQAKGNQSGNTMQSGDWFSQTVYGQQYAQLRKSVVTTGWVV